MSTTLTHLAIIGETSVSGQHVANMLATFPAKTISIPLITHHVIQKCEAISSYLFNKQPFTSFVGCRKIMCSQTTDRSRYIMAWHVLSRRGCDRPSHRQWQHQRNKGNNASMTRAAMPAKQGQWFQHKVGDNANTIDDASVTKAHACAMRATT